MAFKTGNYTILASYQYYDNDGSIHIYVAIESSPGRFKVYVMKEHFTPDRFCMDNITNVARGGGKIGEDTAKKLFPLVAASFEYEG